MTTAMWLTIISLILSDAAFIAFIDWWNTKSILATGMILTLVVFIIIILFLSV